MSEITTVGIDLAKHVFSLHGVDSTGRVALRKTLRRDQLEGVVATLPACLIGMEAVRAPTSSPGRGKARSAAPEGRA